MPDWKNLIRRRIAPLGLQPIGEARLVDEIAQHLEDCYRDLLSGGTSESEARRRTIAELDDLYPLREEIAIQGTASQRATVPPGDARSSHFFDSLGRDLRYACRAIRKSPVFAVFVILTLALGIGANTTVFTLIDTLILNPLAVRDPNQLASVQTTESRDTAKSAMPLPVSYPNLKDYREKNKVFSSLAGYTGPRVMTWQPNGPSQRVFAEIVTGNYFSTLGLVPARGRFSPSTKTRFPAPVPSRF